MKVWLINGWQQDEADCLLDRDSEHEVECDLLRPAVDAIASEETFEEVLETAKTAQQDRYLARKHEDGDPTHEPLEWVEVVNRGPKERYLMLEDHDGETVAGIWAIQQDVR